METWEHLKARCNLLIKRALLKSKGSATYTVIINNQSVKIFSVFQVQYYSNF
jgi:hypothetical protein